MKRVCHFCKREKELNEKNFAWKNKGKGTFQYGCRPCQSEYRKAHYQANKKKYVDKAKIWTEARKREFFTWLRDQKCVDCGNDDLRVLEFDHRNPESKSGNISRMLTEASSAKLEEEMAKCDIVCANCHRIRTAERGNYYSYLIQD